MVRGRHAQRLFQLRRPSSRQAWRPNRHHLGRRRSESRQEDNLQATARRSAEIRQRPQAAGRQEGRPRHHLHADDSGSGGVDSGLRAHRRDPLGDLRWLRSGFDRGACRGVQICVVTADEGLRGGRKIPLKANVDTACDKAGGVTSVIVVRHTKEKVNMKAGRDVYYDEIAKTVPADCPCEEMSAEDPLFILYTSGSTGKPKGVLHTTGGYLLYTSITHQYVFDYHDGDIYW